MKDEKIDVNSLTQKELLLLLRSDVKRLEIDIKEKTKIDQDLILRVAKLETKMTLYAGGVAAVVTLGLKLIEIII